MNVRSLVYVVFRTSRPSQLLLIAGVYLLGAVAAAGHGATLDAMALLVGALPLLLLSASVHYANEFADVETDALTDRTPFSGGSGALSETGLSRRVSLAAGLVSFVGGVLAAGSLWTTGWLSDSGVVVLGVATAVGWQYSVGPLKLAWRGLGEVTNAALGGLALPVYGAAVLDGPLSTVTLASVPFFLVVLLNLFATQWPDREADAAVGKRTLAVRLPPAWLRLAYVSIAVVAMFSVVVLHWAVTPVVLPRAVVVASLLVAPLLVWGAWGYTRRHVPLPTVTAMVGLAAVQFLGWVWALST